MKALWDEVRPLLVYLAAFSFFINLLFLTPAIFMLQVFDRVLPSNSQETLLVLLPGTGIALLILLLLDYVRTRLQNVLGAIIDERLSPPVVNAIVAKSARAPHAARLEGIRDVATLRAVFANNGLSRLVRCWKAPLAGAPTGPRSRRKPRICSASSSMIRIFSMCRYWRPTSTANLYPTPALALRRS